MASLRVRSCVLLLSALCMCFAVNIASGASAKPACTPIATTLFVSSAKLNGGSTSIPTTVTLPLYKGMSKAGATIYYIITEASTEEAAMQYGVNYAPLLARAANTGAVQNISTSMSGTMVFPASVVFAPRTVTPGPYGWPPVVATPGAMGEKGYSPLVQLPSGVVLNAPIVATASSDGKLSGRHNQAVSFSLSRGTVDFVLRNGFANGKTVLYISTDASADLPAALEGATLAPCLLMTPEIVRDTNVAFVNGQTGRGNPNRQGLNSTLLDGLSPLNQLGGLPSDGETYTPIWTLFVAAWAPNATRTRQTSPDVVLELAAEGMVTGAGGGPLGPATPAFIVNCAVIAELLPPAFP